MVAVVEEAEGAATRSGVVDDFRHDGVVLTEIEFVADTDFAGRVYKHIPQAQVAVEFAQQEHFDARTGLLFVAIKTRRKHLRVVEHKDVVLIEVFEEILEHAVFDFARFAVEHHHAAFIAMGGGILGNLFLRELVFELREFHNEGREDVFSFVGGRFRWSGPKAIPQNRRG